MPRSEFSTNIKRAAFERSGGHCEKCGARLSIGKFRYDHIVPDALGGRPTLDNCRVQCIACDKPKTADDVRQIRKADRQKARHIGAKAPSRKLKGRGFQKKAKAEPEATKIDSIRRLPLPRLMRMG